MNYEKWYQIAQELVSDTEERFRRNEEYAMENAVYNVVLNNNLCFVELAPNRRTSMASKNNNPRPP